MNGKLIVSEAGRDRVHELFDELTVIGRGETADLHLRDPESSASHCEVRRFSQGYKLIDLESQSGTYVNGEPINQCFLRNGDTIRIGNAQITYLGSSASPKSGPPAMPRPLRNLPLDENGRPRRFYRHESQSPGMQTGVKAVIIVFALAVLGLFILMMAKSNYGNEGATNFASAQRHQRQGDEKSLREAERLLKGIPLGQFDEREIKKLLEAVQSDLHILNQAKLTAEEQAFYAETINYFLSHPEDASYLRGRINIYQERFPNNPRLQELRDRLEIAELGGPAKQQEWRATEDALRSALARVEFKQAFEILGLAEQDPAFAKIHKERLRRHRSELERRFRSFYEKMSERALDAKASGDTAGAASIYEQIAETGVEPFASEARRFLDKLK